MELTYLTASLYQKTGSNAQGTNVNFNICMLTIYYEFGFFLSLRKLVIYIDKQIRPDRTHDVSFESETRTWREEKNSKISNETVHLRRVRFKILDVQRNDWNHIKKKLYFNITTFGAREVTTLSLCVIKIRWKKQSKFVF